MTGPVPQSRPPLPAGTATQSAKDAPSGLGHDVREPEREHGVEVESPVPGGRNRDQHGEQHTGAEVAGGSAWSR